MKNTVMSKETLLIGTRKGLITYKKSQGNWKYQGISFLGIPVNLTYVDPLTNTWWACLDHGHWGCKLHKSVDQGANWEEVTAPRYPENTEIKNGEMATVKYLWAVSNGGGNKPNELLIGTEPGGLFSSSDNGGSFALNDSLWNHPSRRDYWFGGGRDHAGIHSIIVDPRDNDHIYVGISVAGVFETKDGGTSWEPKNKGLKADFLPDPDAEVGQDPHLLIASPSNPNVLWQQNHCGIFRSENGGESWSDISQEGGPAYFGFAIAADEKDDKTAWVVPAVSDQLRVAVDNALCVCRTEDGGNTWNDFRNGLPQESCFDIVFRHALDVTNDTLAFGTTTGNLFLSDDRGESWRAISHHLPLIYSVSFI